MLQIAGSLESLQLHLIRAFGAMMVGDSYASFATQSQLDTTEASVFSSRTVVINILTSIQLLMFFLQNVGGPYT